MDGIPNKNHSHFSALWEIGMFKSSDLVVICFFFASLAFGTIWVVARHADLKLILVFLITYMVLFQLWTATLIFRCIWFVVRQWADIKMLPTSAAKLAIAFTQGQAPHG